MRDRFTDDVLLRIVYIPDIVLRTAMQAIIAVMLHCYYEYAEMLLLGSPIL